MARALLVVVLLSVLTVIGCGGAGDDVAGADAASSEVSDAALCIESEERPCGKLVSMGEGFAQCLRAIQVCRAGAWSECGEEGPVSFEKVPVDGTPSATQKTLGAPTRCITSPCDPDCRTFLDTPAGVLDGGGLGYADGGLSPLAGAPGTFVRTFQAETCPIGRRLRWGLFTWDTTTPLGSNVAFDFKTSDTETGLGTATSKTVAVAGYLPLNTGTAADPQRCRGLCYRDLGTLSPNDQPFLRMTATLSPSASGSPVLSYWNVTYSCVATSVLSISISPDPVSVEPGGTLALKVVANMADGTTRDVTSSSGFTIDLTSIATVTGSTLKGVSNGVAKITATDYISGLVDTVPVKVMKKVSRLDVTPATSSIAMGASAALTATLVYADGTTANVTSTATWASSDVSVATVTAGAVKGVKTGNVTVTAADAFSGVSGSATVNVYPTVTSLSISPSTASVERGTTTALKAIANWSDGTVTNVTSLATWSSAATTIATVSAGTVTGKAVGSTTITAAYSGFSASAKADVLFPSIVSLAITPVSPRAPVGRTVALTATATYADGTSAVITPTWSSSLTSIATVDTAGSARALAVGTTTITATSGGKSASVSFVVDAPVLDSIALTPTSASVPKGSPATFKAIGTYSDGSTSDVTTTAVWTSSATSIATVAGGVASTLATGTTNVCAAIGAISRCATLTVTAHVVVSLAITPNTASVPKGMTATFVVTATWTDGTTNVTSAATWTVGTPSIATRTSGGTFSALATGSTSIVASYAGFSAPAVMNVTSPVITALSVAPTSASIAKGRSRSFVATATFSDGTTGDVTASATWTSGSIASLVSPGTFKALGTGTTTVTAAMGTVTASATLVVTAAVIDAIAITPGGASVAKGLKQTFVATATYSDATTAVVSATWSTSPVVGTFSGATLSTTAIGTTTVSATSSGVTGTTTFTVTAPAITGLSISPGSASVADGLTASFVATATYTDGTSGNVTSTATWTSGSTTVASVSAGLATGKSPGSTTITASIGGFSASASLNVTAPVVVSIAIVPSSASVPRGTTVTLAAIATLSDGSTGVDVTATSTWGFTAATTAFTSLGAGKYTASSTATVGTAATATVTNNGKTATASLTVAAPKMTGLAVAPTTLSIYATKTGALTATATWSDGTSTNVTTSASWSTSDASIATVASGTVTGVAVGSATISASSGGLSADATVTVLARTISSLAINPGRFALAGNDLAGYAPTGGFQRSVTATATWSDGSTTDVTATATWTSDAPSIASSLGAGKFAGGTPGSTTVRATVDTVEGTATIDVFRVAALRQLAVGGTSTQGHACMARPTSGELHCWGYSTTGALGIGATGEYLTPQKVALTGVVGVSAGRNHTCAILHDGSIHCFGANAYGQIGDGTTTSRLSPVKVLSEMTGLTTGGDHSCAIAGDGTARCWGESGYGATGYGSTTDAKTPVTVTGLSSVIQISGGGDHSCAVTSAGALYCWGRNGNAQVTGVTSDLTNRTTPYRTIAAGVTAAGPGATHTCAVVSSKIVCFGSNANGQIGNGSTSTGNLALTTLASPTNAVDVTSGLYHSCLATSDGRAFCWGTNGNGQLGLGNFTTYRTPQELAPKTTGQYAEILAGPVQTCSLSPTFGRKCWGYNYWSQLGLGFWSSTATTACPATLTCTTGSCSCTPVLPTAPPTGI